MINENIMLQIADMVDSGILVVCQNRVVYQNPIAASILNLFHNTLNVGETFFSKEISISKEKIRSWQRAMAAGELWQDKVEVCIGSRNVTLEVKAKSVDGRYGKNGYYLFTLQVIAEKEVNILPKEELPLSLIIDNAPFLAVQWDEEGRIIYVNKTLKRFLGLEFEELVGRSFYEFMPESAIKLIDQQFEKLKKDGGYAVAESRIHVQGKERRALWMSAQTIAKNGKDHFFSVGIDVTDRNIWDDEYIVLRQQYNTLFASHLEYPLFILNKNLKITFANDSAIQWFEAKGYKRESTKAAIFNLAASPIASEYKELFRQNQHPLKPRIYFENDEVFESYFFPLVQNSEIDSIIVEHRKVKGFKRELMLLDIEGELPQSIIETAKTCILRLNEDMEITYANAEFASLLQYDPLELIGTYIPTLIVPQYREASLKRFSEFKSGTSVHYHEDAEVYRKDGKTVWVEVLVTGVRREDGSFSSLTATLNDITKRKKREAELKNQLIQVKKVKNNMDKFYSIIGHDLKNPLLTTKLISESLLQHVEQQNDTKSAKYLRDITFLAENGLDLLDNLVSWTKSVIEGFDYQPSHFSLRRLCADIEKHFTVSSQIRGILLVNEVSEDIRIFADRNMLKTVIRNLVSNAIKYSHSGGVVSINAILDTDKVIITVSDKGIGIDANVIPHLFEINPKKPRTSSNSKTGNGIGLLICNHFVERHGGHISVESTIGCGTTVRVELKN
jgi:PAS domain S-box